MGRAADEPSGELDEWRERWSAGSACLGRSCVSPLEPPGHLRSSCGRRGRLSRAVRLDARKAQVGGDDALCSILGICPTGYDSTASALSTSGWIWL